ncbi:hypothetical protein CORT_0A00300 [Candida orthopsilosis Co 90-125]|uniref:Uncharacterized protein n=1 Tax=Candida orthopsilosis (strain 90-125) TaxID=1136231 RepID=H8WVF1_CANO9|nr:hypothetical protein CORT_0A00300 [Candida orthopsilosis Co 90-125]CCG20423.1 hypothetical protein CORT_0A00300 [Candida orthopsilosis Co 90-125]
MFRRTIQSQLRFKPTTQLRFARQISTDINNGQKGLPVWPNKATIASVFAKEGRSLVGWFVALTGIMLWGPFAIVKLSDSVDHVPKDHTAQVSAQRVGLDEFKTEVDIPQTYVAPDKEGDDDDE